ncbi:MAG: HTH-type transcriptional activator IlvY [Cellvibrionaceae bacterium]
MDTRSLQLFLHLSETLHFGKTSQAMHLSPSALTRTIQQLEENLDTPLFVRDNRSVSLTRSGKLFQEYARESLHQWQLFQNSLMEETQELQGDISIYCSVTASYSFLYNILSDFRSAHDKIGIRLHTGDPEHAITRIQQNEEDVSIASRPYKLPTTLAFKRIAASALVMIAPIGQKNIKEWDKTPMILSEEGIIRKRMDKWFQQNTIKPNVYAQVAGNEAIVSMVSLGFGIGVVPEIVLNNSPLKRKVTIVDNQPELDPIEVGLCTQKKRLQSPIISALWDSLST